MIAPDTSLVVALFASWHEAHDVARKSVTGEMRLPAHVLVESYSVLTRLPPPHRASADVVTTFMRARFPSPPLTLPAEELDALIELARAKNVTGGSIYDALVAATAKHAGATLLTRDRRAIRTYELVGANYSLVG